jgi:hypothetical protein
MTRARWNELDATARTIAINARLLHDLGPAVRRVGISVPVAATAAALDRVDGAPHDPAKADLALGLLAAMCPSLRTVIVVAQTNGGVLAPGLVFLVGVRSADGGWVICAPDEA